MPGLLDLPFEILVQIALKLDRPSLANLCQLCPSLYNARFPLIWNDFHWECSNHEDRQFLVGGWNDADASEKPKRAGWIKTLIHSERKRSKCNEQIEHLSEDCPNLDRLLQDYSAPGQGLINLKNLGLRAEKIDLSWINTNHAIERISLYSLIPSQIVALGSLKSLRNLQELQIITFCGFHRDNCERFGQIVSDIATNLKCLVSPGLECLVTGQFRLRARTRSDDASQSLSQLEISDDEGSPYPMSFSLPHFTTWRSLEVLIQYAGPGCTAAPSRENMQPELLVPVSLVIAMRHPAYLCQKILDLAPRLRDLRIDQTQRAERWLNLAEIACICQMSHKLKRIELSLLTGTASFGNHEWNNDPCLQMEHMALRIKTTLRRKEGLTESQKCMHPSLGLDVVRLVATAFPNLRILELRSRLHYLDLGQIRKIAHLKSLEVFTFDYGPFGSDIRMWDLAQVLATMRKLKFVGCVTAPLAPAQKFPDLFHAIGTNVVKGPNVADREKRLAQRRDKPEKEVAMEDVKHVMAVLSKQLLVRANNILYANVSYSYDDSSPGFDGCQGSRIYTKILTTPRDSRPKIQIRRVCGDDYRKHPVELSVIDHTASIPSWVRRDEYGRSIMKWYT